MRKKFLKLVFALFAAILVIPLVSCSSDDDSVKNYTVTLSVGLPSGITADNVENLEIILTKGTKSDTIHAANLDITTWTKTLPQGQYTIKAQGKVKDEAAAYLTGTASVDLYANSAVTLQLTKNVKSPLIFKSLYTTGGQTGYMVDGYFEIVNNSDEVQYLDGLILSAPQGKQTNANAWQANGFENLYNCGQGTVIAFPGSGKDYPLQPGESVLIAQDAANHAELAGNGNYCVDLSKANFEIYIDNVKAEIDYPATNMKIIFQNNAYMRAFGLGFLGRAYILAKLPTGITPEAFAANSANLMTTPGSTSSTQYLMIPSKYVLDAVDIWDPDSGTHYGTFLPSDDQEGVLGSTAWAGQCVRRKVIKIENGRPYYQDTNNSSQDFLTNQPLTPGVTPTTVDK
jgi:hypothetical protein